AAAGDAPADRATTVSLHARALAVASRAVFDAHLLAAARQAGAELIATRVTRVGRLTALTGRARPSPAFRLATSDGRTHDVDILVGADGANSLVRRTMASAFRRDQLSIATGFFAHGVTSDT